MSDDESDDFFPFPHGPVSFKSRKSLPTKERTLEDLFLKVTSGKDSITFDKFYKALTRHHIKCALTKDELKTQWIIIDVDGNDEMDLEEFKTLMKSNFGAYDNKKQIQIAFNNIKNELMPDNQVDLLVNHAIHPRASILKKNVKIGISSRALKSNKANKLKMDKKLKEIFETIDADGSGTIDMNEMWQVIQILQLDMTKSELTNIFNFYDTDKSGSIQFDEFKRWMTSQLTKLFGDTAVQLTKLWTKENILKVQQSTRASQVQQLNKAFNFDETVFTVSKKNILDDTKDDSKDYCKTNHSGNKIISQVNKPDNKSDSKSKHKSESKTNNNDNSEGDNKNEDDKVEHFKTLSGYVLKNNLNFASKLDTIITEEISEYANPNKKEVKAWDINKVCEWVKYIFEFEANKDELNRYEIIFKNLKINGKKLITMHHRTDWFALKWKDKNGNILKLTNENGKRHITFGYRKVKKIVDPSYIL